MPPNVAYMAKPRPKTTSSTAAPTPISTFFQVATPEILAQFLGIADPPRPRFVDIAMPDTEARGFDLRIEDFDDVHSTQPVTAAANDRGGPRGPGGGASLQDTGTGLPVANQGPGYEAATRRCVGRLRERTTVAVTAIITAAVTVVLVAAMAML